MRNDSIFLPWFVTCVGAFGVLRCCNSGPAPNRQNDESEQKRPMVELKSIRVFNMRSGFFGNYSKQIVTVEIPRLIGSYICPYTAAKPTPSEGPQVSTMAGYIICLS